jgi:hypothetical protein
MVYYIARSAFVPLLAVVGWLCLPSSLAAQTQSVALQTEKELTLRASTTGGYDGRSSEDVVLPAGFNPAFLRSSGHFGGNVQLQLSVPRRRVGFNAGVGSSYRMYQRSRTVLFSQNAAAGASFALTPHLLGYAGVVASHSPPYQANLFPSNGQIATGGQAFVLPLDSSLATGHLITYGTSTALTYNATKQSSFTFGHEYRRLRSGGSMFGGSVQASYGEVHRRLTQSLGVHFRYRGQVYEYTDRATGTRSRLGTDNLDLGLDYGKGRGFALSQSTTLRFDFGLGTYVDRAKQVRWTALGGATIGQELFRTWHLGVGYNRRLNVLDGFAYPIFSDSVNARLSNQVSRRVLAFASAAYSFDRYEGSASATGYRSYRNVAGVRATVTQRLSAFVQYVNYHHAFPETAFLLQGALPRLNRQGINGGLNLTFPLIGRRLLPPEILP